MKDLWQSKKFRVALLGMAGAIARGGLMKAGIEIPMAEYMTFNGMLVSYIVGQGIADHGKEAEAVRQRQDGK